MRDRKRIAGLARHAMNGMRADLRASRLLPIAIRHSQGRTPEKAALAVSLYYLDRLSDD